MSESVRCSAGIKALADTETIFLARLVSVRSESGNEGPACRLLASMLLDLGWERVEIDDAGSVVATRGAERKSFSCWGT